MVVSFTFRFWNDRIEELLPYWARFISQLPGDRWVIGAAEAVAGGTGHAWNGGARPVPRLEEVLTGQGRGPSR